MSRGYYICSKTGERIEELDSYDKVCEKWEYWNPSHPPDWNPHLRGKNCRGCKYAGYHRK